MRRIALAAILLGFLATTPPVRAAGLIPAGAAFEVEPPEDPDHAILNIRGGAAAAALPGGFVAVWQEDLVDLGLEDSVVAGRRVGFASDPGPRFEVADSYVFPRQQYVTCPDVAPLGGGLFVTAWHWTRFQGSDVAFRRQRSDGSALDSPFRIVGDSLDDLFVGCPALAGNPNGGFAFAWTEQDRAHPDQVTYRLQPFGGDGEPAGPVVSLGVPEVATAGAAARPAVGIDRAGRSVAAWADGLGFILGRRFGKDGAPRGEFFRIGRGGGSSALAIKAGGGFVAAWSRAAAGGRQVLLRGYDAAGRPLGLPRAVARTDEFASPTLRLDRSGRVVLFWVDGGNRFIGRLFTPGFEPLGSEVFAGFVAGEELDTRPYAGVALLGNRVFAVWADSASIGSQAVVGRYFAIEP